MESAPLFWQTSRFRLSLSRPLVMGIVNVTPDSFSDGCQHQAPLAALAHCERLIAQGADILDIGGESTRPGSMPPTAQEEMDRVLPVLAQAVGLGVPISVDTSNVALMQAALDLGVDIVNDVRALARPGALACVAAHPRAGVSLMHIRGEPSTMASFATYEDLVREVRQELASRLLRVQQSGIDADRVVLDPGIGFAKTASQNVTLLSRQRELLSLGRPLLVGWSRKGTLGQITGRPVHERLPASVAAALAAVAHGALVVRVHDVAATVDALAVWRAAQTGQLELPAPR